MSIFVRTKGVEQGERLTCEQRPSYELNYLILTAQNTSGIKITRSSVQIDSKNVGKKW